MESDKKQTRQNDSVSGRGFQRVFNPYYILSVIFKTKEKKTSIIKKKLDPVFENMNGKKPTSKWYNDATQKLEKEGLVKRIEKETDPAYYWVITEEGIRKLDEFKKEQED